jgi:FdhD protein
MLQPASSAIVAGARPAAYWVHQAGDWRAVDGAVIEEVTATLHVNGQPLASFMCSPMDLKAMALGFLRTEELIAGLEEVELVELSPNGTCVDVWLRRAFTPPARPIRTSGCSGGITFDDLAGQRPPLPPGPRVAAPQVIARCLELREAATLYPIARGVHASALCTPDALLLVAEDVGRHNTLDKLAGKAMLEQVDTAGRLLVTTGRISTEMLGKAAKLGVPLVASRTSPTSRSLALAQAWNITVIGYVRRESLRVYTAPERVVTEGESDWPQRLATDEHR